MSAKLICLTPELAWGVKQGLVHYPRSVMTKKDVDKIWQEKARRHYDAVHGTKSTHRKADHADLDERATS